LNSAICHVFTGLHVQRVKKGIMPWLDSRCGDKEMSPLRENINKEKLKKAQIGDKRKKLKQSY